MRLDINFNKLFPSNNRLVRKTGTLVHFYGKAWLSDSFNANLSIT